MERDHRQTWAQETAPQDGPLEIVIQADPQAAAAVTDGVSRLLEAWGWPEVRVSEVHLALQEALANAIRHGCRSDPSRAVRCLVSCDESGDLTIVVGDRGDGFEASAVAH